MLLKARINNTDLLKHRATRNQGLGWTNVKRAMWSSKLYYSVRQLKSRLKGLIMSYGKCQDDREYKPFVGAYLGRESFPEGRLEADISSAAKKCSKNASKKKESRSIPTNWLVVLLWCAMTQLQ